MDDRQKIIGHAESIIELADDGDPVMPPIDPPEERPAGNYLIVGEGSGGRGEHVTIQILGQTESAPVNGMGMYFGCSPEVEMVSFQVPNEIKNLTELTDPMHTVSQLRGQHSQQQFIACFVGFFQTVTVDSPLGQGNRIASVILPPLTPLLEITFKLPDTAVPKHRYTLDNRTWYYGRQFKDAGGNSRILKTTNMFTTDRNSGYSGIEPDLIGGWIDVR